VKSCRVAGSRPAAPPLHSGFLSRPVLFVNPTRGDFFGLTRRGADPASRREPRPRTSTLPRWSALWLFAAAALPPTPTLYRPLVGASRPADHFILAVSRGAVGRQITMQKICPAGGGPSAQGGRSTAGPRGGRSGPGAAAAGAEAPCARGDPGRLGATTRRPPTRGGGGDRGAPSGAPLRRAHPIGAVSRGGLVRLCSRGRCQVWTWAARGTRSQLIVGAPAAGALEHVAVAAERTEVVQRGGDDAGADHKGPSLGRGRPVAPTTRCTRGCKARSAPRPRPGAGAAPRAPPLARRVPCSFPISLSEGWSRGRTPGRRAATRGWSTAGRRRARTRAMPWCASAQRLSRGRRPVKGEGAPRPASRAQLFFLLIS
jgi:hypothetical protein